MQVFMRPSPVLAQQDKLAALVSTLHLVAWAICDVYSAPPSCVFGQELDQ